MAEPDMPSLTAEQEARAREALRQKLAALEPSVEPLPAPVPDAPLPAAPAPVVVRPAVVAPPVIPESEKEGWERLAELTDQYRAGLITPYQYHTERAKIVPTLRR
jgi:hypothetical protein